MIGTISPNTQAILLLTAPLIAPGGQTSDDLMPLGLYKALARQLRALAMQPADLLTPHADTIIAACGEIVDGDRLRRLLARGFLLSQVVERWQARAIWVISRADPTYPRRLKHRLRDDAPPLLYGCGPVARLDDGGLAIVGSRDVDDRLIAYSEAVAAMAARSGHPVVSGGARGIDQAAMRGAADYGGQVVGLLADGLEKSAMLRDHRQPLMDGRLVLISPYDPGARFNVGHAMQRNKLIYALADAALVVSSDVDRGGTWAGATEQLDRFRFVPVYVRQSGSRSEGLDALCRRGAIPWPEPQDADGLAAIFRNDSATEATSEVGSGSPDVIVDMSAEPSRPPWAGDASEAIIAGTSPADRLWDAVRPILLALLTTPHAEAGVANMLDVSRGQARIWLARLVAEGAVSKDGTNRYLIAPEGFAFSGMS